MSGPRPPSTPRVVAILACVAIRRFLNRLRARRLARRRKKSSAAAGRPARTGTARKARGGGLLMPLVGLLFLWNGFMIAGGLVLNLAGEADARAGSGDGRIEVSWLTYSRLEDFVRKARELAEESRSRQRPALRPSSGPRPEPSPAEIEAAWDELLDPSNAMIERLREARERFGKSDEPPVEDLLSTLRRRGLEAFEKRKPRGFFPTPDRWPSAAGEPRFLAALAILHLLLWIALVATELGGANRDLASVEWTLEWLFTFPVRARSLFLAQLLQYAALHLLSWFMVFPLSTALLLLGGWGWWAPAGALAMTLYTNVLLAAARQIVEVLARKRLAPARRKNLQALLTVVGLVALFAGMAAAVRSEESGWIFQVAGGLPAGLLWAPSSLPALLAAGGGGAGLALAGMGLLAVAALLLAPLLAERLIGDGLVASSASAYQGRRGRGTARALGRGWLGRGIAGKELRHLLRDRNFFVQLLVAPLLVIVFQLFVHGGWRDAAAGSFANTAILAFAIGGFVVMGGGFSALSSEGRALWLLYTFPRRLDEIIRAKAIVWASLGGIYTAATLAIFAPRATFGAQEAALAATALAGVAICAVVATSLGVFATDPLQKREERRGRPLYVYAYMLLASMYALGIYASDSWGRLKTVALGAAVALAIWDRMRDRLPYLLDPVSEPPPRLRFSQAMFAVFAYFALLQVFVAAFGAVSRGPFPGGPWALLSLASLLAGSVVSVATILLLARSRIPDLLERLGLRSPWEERGRGPRALLLGAIGGAAAGGAACAWRALATRLGLLDAEALASPPLGFWFGLLCIALAPLFEELLFRGLLFRSLRETRSLPVAALASAAIFALVHPAASFVPVFGLGVATALVFERAKLLFAPIVAHAIYNAIVLWTSGG